MQRRSTAAEQSKSCCCRRAARAFCRTGYSVRRRRRAASRRTDGRGVSPRQAAPKRQNGLHSELSYKRLERGKFIWPSASGGAVSISAAQMAYMLEGIDWRNPQLTWRPKCATWRLNSMLWERCLAMGFHLSKARLEDQILNSDLSGPRGPLQSRVSSQRKSTLPRKLRHQTSGHSRIRVKHMSKSW